MCPNWHSSAKKNFTCDLVCHALVFHAVDIIVDWGVSAVYGLNEGCVDRVEAGVLIVTGTLVTNEGVAWRKTKQ